MEEIDALAVLSTSGNYINVILQSGFAVVNGLSSKHRVLKKNFETEMLVDNRKLPLNHFVQETLANMMIGLLKTLKEVKPEESPKSIEIKIRKLPKPLDVDAHTYP